MSKKPQNKLFNRVSGKGYPVVFLHGFLESSTMWKEIVIKSVQSIYIDLPGHGNSNLIALDESISTMAEKVIALLLKLDVKKCTIIGHSMGGYVGLEIIKQSDICEQLILLNSNCWEDDASKKRDRDRVSEIVKQKKVPFIYDAIPNLFHDPAKYDAEVQELIGEAVEIEAEAISICSQAMKNRVDNTPLLLEKHNHICIIQGVNDPIVDLFKMRAIIKNTKADYFEVDSGHMAHIEAKQELIEILDKKITETN